jgi:ribosomal protein S6E (S10)
MRLLVRRARLRLACRLGHHAEGVQLHQPHADARGAGDLAGGADAACAAAAPGHHLPHQQAEFLAAPPAHRPGDNGFWRRLSLIDEHGERRVRMAHLSIVGSHKVNGVSALALRTCWCRPSLPTFASLWPERFTNMTNGVTPRRWLAQANPGLASLIDHHGQRLAA